MNNLVQLLDLLWDRFLMRDVVAKAIPGTLLLASFLVAVSDTSPEALTSRILPNLKDLPAFLSALLAVVLFGASYIAGFVVQTAAFDYSPRRFQYGGWDIIIYQGVGKYASDPAKITQALDNKNKIILQKRDALVDDLHRRFSLEAFSNKVKDQPHLQRQRERFVVINTTLSESVKLR